ncbi:Rieske (2Fe-2S) protein [Flagellimonas flava]|uniref:Ferredoxin subunit of nitrite reductase or a ring-hydroxylating dioxygenase n=1 Tax=Flagellimonas flava TaxID=570519 RepID=A0A1M5HL76_9FLAO|nr:Rieske 2Fe-2S domain-containing protein [Allomuricauda flava]SHG16661.1 Ferredoxin subunit of nitrite reductase or a ring-hydroxylating dioxygenase [Allomuricauda flava]
MERKDFLRSLGAGAAFALTFPCLNGCSTDSEDLEQFPEPDGVDFTVDLTAPESSPLESNGGFILVKSDPGLGYTDIVVARNLEGELIAASQICSHQQTEEVRFLAQDGGVFSCSTHGSRFSQNGTPLNSVTNNPLRVFSTELNGDSLRVFES